MSTTITQNGIGYGVPGYAPLNGDIAEIVVFSGALTTADRERVVGYLAHKWGLTAKLPTAHPYKTSAAARHQQTHAFWSDRHLERFDSPCVLSSPTEEV